MKNKKKSDDNPEWTPCKLTRQLIGLLLCSVLGSLSFSVLSQDAGSEPQSDDAELEVLEEEEVIQPLIPVEILPAEDEEDSEESQAGPDQQVDLKSAISEMDLTDPEPPAGEEGAEGNVKASMERFVPSEKISEDRSVAFPNDI